MRKRIKSNTRPLAVNRDTEKQNALNLKNVCASFGFSLAYVYLKQTKGKCTMCVWGLWGKRWAKPQVSFDMLSC